jgi:predicted O-methyltransferase YrrM
VNRLARVTGYPLRYAGALRTAMRLRRLGSASPEHAFDLAQSLRWHGDHLSVTQSREEIVSLLELLRREAPRVVLEIGLDQGGTLFLWTRVAADDAHLISIDVRPLGVLGQRSAFAVARRGFARAGQRIDLIMPADSHSEATRDRIQTMLDGRVVDFLFVDGDHSYEGVKRDFELYSPLVREGGIVAFHDVATPAEPHVVRFWNEFRQEHTVTEYTARTGEPYGIGIYRMSRAR